MNLFFGMMEIKKNKIWNKFCILNWNEDENILMCMVMGYFENSFYDNVWYKVYNVLNVIFCFNCLLLMNCIGMKKGKF